MIYSLIFLIIDIISKYIVSSYLVEGKSIRIISDFFKLTYVKNDGIAWSMLAGKKLLIIGISIGIIGYLIYYIKKNNIKNIGYSMVLGGAIGNLVDRIFLGYVVDFLDFNIFGYEYPIFNLADSFIFIGVIIIIFRGNKK